MSRLRERLDAAPCWVLPAAVGLVSLVVRGATLAQQRASNPLFSQAILDDRLYLDLAGAVIDGSSSGQAWFLAPLYPWILAQVSRFEENMTGGVGFIGLAAMIFGRWMPTGAMAAGLVFGFSRAVQQKVALLGTPIPSEFLEMIPFLVTIVVVAGVVGKARPPAADGVAYIKQ